MFKITKSIATILALVSSAVIGGCASPGGNTMHEKRASVMDMRTEALAELSQQNPTIMDRVKAAPGYGVFSNYGLKILVAGGGNGYGIVRDNATGDETYMRMGEVNVGLGFGAKDFRVLFVFNTERALHDFIEMGWNFGGDAEVGAKLKSEGAEAGKAVSVGDIDIYQFTRSGAMIQATVGGTKYWKDKDLNAAE